MSDDFLFTEDLCFLNFRIRWHTNNSLLIDILKEQFLYNQSAACSEYRDEFDFFVEMIPDSDGDVSWNTALQHHYDSRSRTLQLSYLDGAIRVTVDYDQRRIQAGIMERALVYRAALGNWVMTIPLSELLKLHNIYLMHAACLVKGGKGVLFAGRSGAGKTTLSIGLLTMGWQMISDDEVFLQRDVNNTIIAWGGPERAKISWNTWRRYAYYLGEQPRFNGKLIVQLGDVFPGQTCKKHRVNLICFIRPDERVILNPLIPRETYQRLLSVAFLNSEPALTRRNSDFLYHLSRTLPAWHLETSLDVKALDARLQNILAKL